MIKLVRKINAHILINSLLTIALGVAMLVEPREVYRVSVNVIAIYMVIIGLINIFDGFRDKKSNGRFGVFLFYGIFYIIIAGIIYLFADQIIKSVPFILGIIILLSGFSHLFRALSLKAAPGFNKVPMYIYSGLLIVVSLFFIFKTVTSLVLLFQLYGIFLIVMGVVDVFLVFYLKKNVG